MAQAKSKTSAKLSPQQAEKPAGSEIIHQSVIYVQAMAAYKAGFTADLTGDWDHCGSADGQLGGKHLREAGHALRQLIAISPAFVEGRAPLSPAELFAKASVLSAVLDQEGGETVSLEPHETTFVKFFAREVSDALSALAMAQ